MLHDLFAGVRKKQVTGIPTSCTFPNTRVIAASYECLRLRCQNSKCKWRPAAAASQRIDLLDEIPMDDREKDVMQNTIEETPDTAGPNKASEEVCPPDDRATAMELFTFSRPVSYYVSLLKELCSVPTVSFLVALTRTAHPGLLVAGRELGLEVLCGQFGTKTHSFEHGKRLMEHIFVKRFWAKAEEARTHGVKRVARSSLTFIVAHCTEEQGFRIKDMAPDTKSQGAEASTITWLTWSPK